MADIASRDAGLDLVRVTATILVIVVHVSANYIDLSSDTDTWLWVASIGSAARMAVPLFVMASGALVLLRVDPLRKTVNRVVKIGLPLIIWSLIYLAWSKATGVQWGFGWTTDTWNPLTIAIMIAGAPIMMNVVFLYAFLALYLFYPFLQPAFRSATRGTRLYMIGITFVASSLITTAASYYQRQIIGIDLRVFAIFPFYAMLGCWLMLQEETGKRTLIAWVSTLASIAGIWAATVWISSDRGALTQVFFEYHSPLVVFSAASGFVAIRGLSCRLPAWSQTLVTRLSPLCFGVFFSHVFFVYYGMMYLGPPAWMPLPVYVLVLSGFVTVLSFTVSLGLKASGLGRWLAP